MRLTSILSGIFFAVRRPAAERTVKASCALCGREFDARARVIARGWGRYCTKRCANIARTLGAKNPNFKGGRAYHKEKVSPEQRARVRARDGERCVQCGRPDKIVRTVKGPKHWLQVHHVLPVGDGGTEDDWNLVSLCPRCHNRIEHGREQLRSVPPRPAGENSV